MKVRKKVTKADPKTVFRRSKAWKTFREKIRKMQRKDPVTGSPLTKGFNLHHLDLNPVNYTNIEDDSKFIGVNSTTHDVIHYFFGDSQRKNDWRTRLARITEILELMDELNKN